MSDLLLSLKGIKLRWRQLAISVKELKIFRSQCLLVTLMLGVMQPVVQRLISKQLEQVQPTFISKNREITSDAHILDGSATVSGILTVPDHKSEFPVVVSGTSAVLIQIPGIGR